MFLEPLTWADDVPADVVAQLVPWSLVEGVEFRPTVGVSVVRLSPVTRVFLKPVEVAGLAGAGGRCEQVWAAVAAGWNTWRNQVALREIGAARTGGVADGVRGLLC